MAPEARRSPQGLQAKANVMEVPSDGGETILMVEDEGYASTDQRASSRDKAAASTAVADSTSGQQPQRCV